MKKIVILLWCVFYAFVANAKVIATIQYQAVQEGEIVELYLSSDVQQQSQPDISVLKNDFDVVGQASRSSFQNINGEKTASYGFVLNLLPKKTGILTIPSILWGSEKTDALKLQVSPAGQMQKTEDEQTITISGNVLDNQVYENAALTYRVVVLSEVAFVDGAFVPPVMENAEVIPLGSIQMGQIAKDGNVFQSLTQDYAIFPSKPGENQIIVGAGFQGIVRKKKKSQHDLLDSFGFSDSLIYAPVASNRKEVLLRAENKKINVLSRPENWGNKWWLPAKQVSATQIFSPDLSMIKVGDSLTRTIEIKSIGSLGTQLPDITFASSNDFKVYSETPQKNSGYEQNLGLVGTLKQSFVFVPLRSGKMILPAMTLYWFDTLEQRQKQVVLPAEEIVVLPSTKEEQSEPQSPSISDNSKEQKNNSEIFQNPYEKENNLLFFVTGLCLGLVLCLIVFALMYHRRKKQLPDLYPKA